MFLVIRLISYEVVFDVQIILLVALEMIMFYSSLHIIVPDVVGEAGASQTNEPSKGQAVRTVSIVG